MIVAVVETVDALARAVDRGAVADEVTVTAVRDEEPINLAATFQKWARWGRPRRARLFVYPATRP